MINLTDVMIRSICQHLLCVTLPNTHACRHTRHCKDIHAHAWNNLLIIRGETTAVCLSGTIWIIKARTLFCLVVARDCWFWGKCVRFGCKCKAQEVIANVVFLSQHTDFCYRILKVKQLVHQEKIIQQLFWNLIEQKCRSLICIKCQWIRLTVFFYQWNGRQPPEALEMWDETFIFTDRLTGSPSPLS